MNSKTRKALVSFIESVEKFAISQGENADIMRSLSESVSNLRREIIFEEESLPKHEAAIRQALQRLSFDDPKGAEKWLLKALGLVKVSGARECSYTYNHRTGDQSYTETEIKG
jgi:hypothetical protein